MSMIYNFRKYTHLNLFFRETFSITEIKHYIFLYIWSCEKLTSPTSSSMDLMAYCNWITTSYINNCFNLLFVSKLFIHCVSLLHYDFVSITSYIIYTLFYKIIVSYSSQCITQPPTKLMMAKYLVKIDHIYDSYKIIVIAWF